MRHLVTLGDRVAVAIYRSKQVSNVKKLGSVVMIRAFLGASLVLWATTVSAATIFTGDTIQGAPVISQLDLADLAPGKMHRFMFRGAETSTGQYWYVPVLVAKGAKPGKRILFVGGNHGDELNPIAAVQATFATLDPTRMTGSAIALIGPSRQGVENITRTWTINELGGAQINPNRSWPGREDGNTVERHCWLITNKLIKGNVDIAIDHHTGGTGIDFARFVFAYANDPESLKLGGLFPVDQVMHDPGLPGTLEFSLVKAGIPAVTTELGGPRGFVADMVKLGVDGNANVLAYYGVVPGPVGKTAADMAAFVGDDLETVSAVAGGFVTVLVKTNDTVTKGQKIAVQRNGFGDIVQDYVSPADGRVAIVGTDAATDRGTEIATILVKRGTCAGTACDYGGIVP
jgi:predicted deacylase